MSYYIEKKLATQYETLETGAVQANLFATLGEDGNGSVNSVAFHPSLVPPLLVTGSSNGYAIARKLLHDSIENYVVVPKHDGTVNSIAFQSKENLMVISSDKKLLVYNALVYKHGGDFGYTQMPAKEMWGSDCPVTIHPKYNIIAVAVKNYDLDSNKEVMKNNAQLMTFDKDIKKLTFIAQLKGHTGAIKSIAFHSNKDLIVTGSEDNTAKVWKFSYDANADATARITEVKCLATLDGYSGSVNSVAFHPVFKIVATGSKDTTIKLWLISEAKFTFKKAATCVATLAGHSSGVNSVAFHASAPFLATGSDDKTAKVWRVSADGTAATCVATLAGHNGSVLSVAFHPTEPLLATGSGDGTAKLWRMSPYGTAANIDSLTNHDAAENVTSDTDPIVTQNAGSVIRHRKKRLSRKVKRYASKRIKKNRNRNKYRKSKKVKTKTIRYRRFR